MLESVEPKPESGEPEIVATPEEVLAALIKQGRPSVHYGTCLYRGPGGCKCAAGWMIDDNVYRSEMEGHGVGTLVARWGVVFPLPIETVLKMQRAHDAAAQEWDTKVHRRDIGESERKEWENILKRHWSLAFGVGGSK